MHSLDVVVLLQKNRSAALPILYYYWMPGAFSAHSARDPPPQFPPHRAPDPLPALLRDTLRYGDGANPPRLRAHDLAAGADARVVQQELRHLGRLTAPGLSAHEARLRRNQTPQTTGVPPRMTPQKRGHYFCEFVLLSKTNEREHVSLNKTRPGR